MATKTTTTKSNLFNKAKASAPAKDTKAKEQKTRIKIKDEDFFDKVSRLEVLNDRMKADKAQADMIADEIKEIGKAEWSKLYDKTGKNPGSVMLEAKVNLDTAQVMYLPSDRYITINEARATALTEKFGEGIVEEKTSFSFDNEMVDKYGEILSELIYGSDEIDEDDKEKIIKAITSYSVAKGSIDSMKKFSEEASCDVFEVFEEIRPVVSLKNTEVIKG
jgi:hypothetical protein